ncbi:DUF6671 family protein [Rufibacter quisquiliarum]|uniref:DUF6671 domain-containing protein n=1 Tax=Rufibacter quisquiliarum TaxID=1549639 RepID=A0A839GGN8_9BACT|nr:DUF6671 family protein [Rufibacter quisquiliarum]MBA9076753.1 hypothetical protein [Rufibacter quisquiliarum]
MALTGETLGIASEGSFGPHPSAWFAPANEEVLLLLDTARELEVVVRKISLETNFAGAQVHTQEELQAFARQVLFPSHGLILSAAAGSTEGLQKGLTSWPQLLAAFRSLVASHGSAYVQTDMRALYNPTRLQVIKQAAQLLMERCTTCCPACHTPGFGVTQAIRGLPCRFCGLPTQSVRSLESACQRCSFTRQDDFPGGAQTEDPTYCENCNP